MMYAEFGSFVDRYPRVTQVWTGDQVGEWYAGGKVNLTSEFRRLSCSISSRWESRLKE